MSRALTVFLIATLFPICALGMTIEVHGDKVFATGRVGDDFVAFENALSKPGITTVVLLNSPGGDLWTGLTVGRLIASKKLDTVAAGSCISSCSLMFMGGRERRFADSFRPNRTFIGIHGAHNTQTRMVDPQLQPQIFAYMRERMGERFNSKVMTLALWEMDDLDALLRVFDMGRNPRRVTYHCRARQTQRKDCTELPEHTASSLGLITHENLVKLDLPQAFQENLGLGAWPLDQLLDDSGGSLERWAKQACTSAQCRTQVVGWGKLPMNRALVMRQNAPLVASWTFNTDTPWLALIRAVYRCNHPTNGPVQLCEAKALNEYDLEPANDRSAAAHQQALRELRLPPNKFYGDEELRGSSQYSGAYRLQKFQDLTPLSLAGIRTIGTQELVALLLSGKPVNVIDVASTLEGLPTAKVLVNGGMALEDQKLEAALDQRFRGLMSLLATDKSQPLVIYGFQRDSWLSVNASLRAQKAGYQSVLWYRGGLTSWRAAELPVAITPLTAVAY